MDKIQLSNKIIKIYYFENRNLVTFYLINQNPI